MNTTQDKKRNSAVYAAAGIGDLAYEQLKKIPALAEELRTKAGTLREQGPSWRAQATDKAAELAGKVDVDKIREALVTNAQKAAEKATSPLRRPRRPRREGRGLRGPGHHLEGGRHRRQRRGQGLRRGRQGLRADGQGGRDPAAKPAAPRKPKATGTAK